MNRPFYKFQILEEAFRFEFESIGKENIIKKVVCYTETSVSGLFNLSLVDILQDGSESDTVVSNNADMETVLATVFQTCNAFLQTYPDYQIFFMGSTPARTRLYQIAINHELNQALDMFDIRGLINNNFEPFKPNRAYEAFVIALK